MCLKLMPAFAFMAGLPTWEYLHRKNLNFPNLKIKPLRSRHQNSKTLSAKEVVSNRYNLNFPFLLSFNFLYCTETCFLDSGN